MDSNTPPPSGQQGQRRIFDFQRTIIRPTSGGSAAPPTMSVMRIAYLRRPGEAPRLLSVHAPPPRLLSNTARFWHKSLARPDPKRTRSLPPSPRHRPLGTYKITKSKKPLWDQLNQHRHSAARLLRQGRDKAREGSNRVFAAVRNAAAKWGTAVVASAIVVGVAYVTTNSFAYNMQTKPAYLTQWAREPTWLYADSPDQILGLHAPLWSTALQPEPVIAYQFKQMNRYWATDKARLHKDANPSNADMKKIFQRYYQAKENYHRRPPYQYQAYEDEDVFNMTIPGDDLPRFQPGCVCNMTLAVTNQVLHALTPYWKHDAPPKSSAEVSSYCPCSVGRAAWRLRQGLSNKFLPPPLMDFYRATNELAMRWDPCSYYLYQRSWRVVTPAEKERARKEGWTKEYVPESRRRKQMAWADLEEEHGDLDWEQE